MERRVCAKTDKIAVENFVDPTDAQFWLRFLSEQPITIRSSCRANDLDVFALDRAAALFEPLFGPGDGFPCSNKSKLDLGRMEAFDVESERPEFGQTRFRVLVFKVMPEL